MNQYKYLEPGTKLVTGDVHNRYALALGKGKHVEKALEQWRLASLQTRVLFVT